MIFLLNFEKNERIFGLEISPYYKSVKTGEQQDIFNFSYEIRGLVGYDLPIFKNHLLTPYGGIGFRYLLDDGGGDTTTTNHYSYDRESTYLYSPIGIDTYSELKDDWAIAVNFEYDLFLSGKQKTHLEDVDSNYSTLVNEQKKGYGVRGSCKLIKHIKDADVYIEPFLRYWNIKSSETEFIMYDGAMLPVEDMPGYYWAGVEPKNYTYEVGLKIGANF